MLHSVVAGHLQSLHCTGCAQHSSQYPWCLAFLLTFLPQLNGTYLYLIMCLIWRRMVTNSSTSQYRRRIGQKTGTSNMGKKVATKPRRNALTEECLHAGRAGLSVALHWLSN